MRGSVRALAQIKKGLGAVAQTGPAPAREESTEALSGFTATGRPPVAQRAFISDAVEDTIVRVKRIIRNPRLTTLFENCYPNTLDTTVQVSQRNGRDVGLVNEFRKSLVKVDSC
jgi:hypothetical protein